MDVILILSISTIPDTKVYGANMGPIWVLLAPDVPHVDPMNLTLRDPVDLDIGIPVARTQS